jgi:hypothetical protein
VNRDLVYRAGPGLSAQAPDLCEAPHVSEYVTCAVSERRIAGADQQVADLAARAATAVDVYASEISAMAEENRIDVFLVARPPELKDKLARHFAQVHARRGALLRLVRRLRPGRHP